MATILDIEGYVSELQARLRAEILTLKTPKATNTEGHQRLGRASEQRFALEVVDIAQGCTQTFFLAQSAPAALLNLRKLARERGW